MKREKLGGSMDKKEMKISDNIYFIGYSVGASIVTRSPYEGVFLETSELKKLLPLIQEHLLRNGSSIEEVEGWPTYAL